RAGRRIDLLDACHALERDHDAPVKGRGTASQSRAPTLRHQGHASLVTDPHDGRYLVGGLGPGERPWLPAGHGYDPVREVAAVDGFPVDHACRSDGDSDRLDHVRHRPSAAKAQEYARICT